MIRTLARPSKNVVGRNLEERDTACGSHNGQITRSQGVAAIGRIGITLGPINMVKCRGTQHQVGPQSLYRRADGFKMSDIKPLAIECKEVVVSQGCLQGLAELPAGAGQKNAHGSYSFA